MNGVDVENVLAVCSEKHGRYSVSLQFCKSGIYCLAKFYDIAAALHGNGDA